MFIAQIFEPLLIVVVQLMHNYSCLLLVDACWEEFLSWDGLRSQSKNTVRPVSVMPSTLKKSVGGYNQIVAGTLYADSMHQLAG